MSRYTFRAPLWAWLGLLPCLALLITLGSWQLHRGYWKTRLQAEMDHASGLPALTLDRNAPTPQAADPVHATAVGEYLEDRQLLLDNQSHDHRPGYQVLTPLLLPDGALVLVNRGWVPQAGDRRQLPDIAVAGEGRSVGGLWRPLPEPGLRMTADNCAERPWPRVVQYPTADDLRCLYAEPALAGMLLLDPAATDGYVRDWRVGGGLPPERHYAYAAQWYAFAATLLFFFIKLNLKRRPAE